MARGLRRQCLMSSLLLNHRYSGFDAALSSSGFPVFDAVVFDAPVELQNSNGPKEPVSMGCAHRTGWAKLMARVFDIDVLACPKCGNEMQQIAFITQASVIRAILNSVGYGCDPPLAVDA